MGTIVTRESKKGTRYSARIRGSVRGKEHRETKTFPARKMALAWIRERESEIKKTGDQFPKPTMTVGEGCAQYLSNLQDTPRGIGRSKKSALRRMAEYPKLQKLGIENAKASDWLKYMQWRLQGVDEYGQPYQRSPATVNEDFQYLRRMLEHAEIVWGLSPDLTAIGHAGKQARQFGLIAKSRGVETRPTIEELDKVMGYWTRERSGRGMNTKTRIPMPLIVLFLIFSTRRSSEVTRLRWDDLDRDSQRILVRAMKHPRQKQGNDVWVHLPDRAMAVIDKMPKTDEFIFLWKHSSIEMQWQRARDWAGVEHVRLHDLRHEGISHLFEMGWDIPRVAMVSGHRSWNTLSRYTHLNKLQQFDKYEGWLGRF